MNTRRYRTGRSACVAACAGAVLALAACGGGGGPDGGGGNIRPDPHIATPYGAWTANPNALDIGEHWREDAAMAAALGTEADAGANTMGLTRAKAAAEAPGNASQTILRNVSNAQVTILGAKDGITIGRWRDGPAGTLDIDFNWDGAPQADAAQRALYERAGREWSRRILSQRAPGVIPEGTEVGGGHPRHDGSVPKSFTVREDIATDGLLIFVLDGEDKRFSYGGPGWLLEGNEWVVRYGRVEIARHHTGRRYVATHEIGHVLEIANLDDEHFARAPHYVDTESHTFTGPKAMEVYGGPVPLQWVDSENNVVAPGTPGARADASHIGACTSIMAYCGTRAGLEGPQPLDFAILEDLGYEILEADEAAEPEVYGLGAWGYWSAWGAGVERQINHERGADHTRANVDAFGVAPSAAFADRLGREVGAGPSAGG